MSERYARQMQLPEVGAEGQARLQRARVLIVGAGGLGCAVLQYLAAAGVGEIIVVDHDRVAESNLHRQPLYRVSDIDAFKVDAARNALLASHPQLHIEAVNERLTPANVSNLVARADIILDAADSFAVTYVLNDECWRAGKLLVSASVLGLTGYVGTFCAGAPSYRAVFPDLPSDIGTCATTGVLGTAVGVVGTLQAHITLALLLRIEPTPLGQLVSIDLRRLRFASFSFMNAPEPASAVAPFIAADQVNEADIVVDLRTLDEAPVSPFKKALRLQPAALECSEPLLPSSKRIVLCCRSGVRAWRAANVLRARGYKDLALVALGD